MFSTRIRFIGIPLLAVSAFGCGKGNHDVTISSQPYATSGLSSMSAARIGAESGAVTASTATTVTPFQFCVSRIKLIGEDGQGTDEIRFAPGLVDVVSGTASVDWGKVSVPTGFRLAGLRIKVHKDKALCGVDYSFRFGTLETSQDVEFKWKFGPAIEFTSSTDNLELSLEELVADLRSADLASLKDRAEAVEGTASASK